jgi:GNAT superfamily N-acetyltransferase
LATVAIDPTDNYHQRKKQVDSTDQGCRGHCLKPIASLALATFFRFAIEFRRFFVVSPATKGGRMMEPKPITKEDYDHIVRVIDAWWGGPNRELAHPIFFYELSNMARKVEDRGVMVAFLLGFITPSSPPIGYVHMVGIHPSYRRKGLGKLLYSWFEKEARDKGCKQAKAITTLGNEGSLLFHQAVGWDALEDPNYAGPGRARVVFRKNLEDEG